MKLLKRNDSEKLRPLLTSAAALLLIFIGVDTAIAQSGCTSAAKVAEAIKEREELEAKPTPMDDPNTNDIIKAEREWRMWGKAEREKEINWLKSQEVGASPCWLRYAKTGKKDLKDAYLAGADLHDLNLNGADLKGAVLDRANLKGADLSGAKMQSASFRTADLTGAKLEGATLTDAKIYKSNTIGVNFDEWKARGAVVSQW